MAKIALALVPGTMLCVDCDGARTRVTLAAVVPTVVAAIVVFAATNIDDIVLLSVMFSDSKLRPRAIVTGQFIGIGALVLGSALAGAAAVAIPPRWTSLLGARPLLLGLFKGLGGKLLRAPAQAGDVVSIQPQLVAVEGNAANDDVRVRMTGVVMIDGRPFDLAPQVLLDAGHQATHVGGQVKLAGVFRRHDESKLVRFAQARFFKGPTPHRSVGPIEHAFGTVRFDAVALDVSRAT